jgi:hypothetical protein
LDALAGIEILPVSPEAKELALAFLKSGLLPKKALIDASHVAISAVHKMDFLLTWNCRHIANAHIRTGIQKVCDQHGFTAPTICTPGELFPSEGL